LLLIWLDQLVSYGSSTLPDGLVQQHIHPNIQQDMDLWHRIREYHKRAAEVPFTPFLSKKQKHKLKQVQVFGKLPYWTCSRATPLQLLNEYFYWNVRGIGNSDSRVALKIYLCFINPCYFSMQNQWLRLPNSFLILAKYWGDEILH